MRQLLLASAGAFALLVSANDATAQTAATSSKPSKSPKTPTAVSEVVVTASRANLLGVAVTASQGSVTQKEVELRPIYRVGQLFETVPGLMVTVHSGESKANQYQLRGIDLGHGSDFAAFVDDMPVNRGTNAHGQGYADQNFLMPQIVSGLDYTKGPYYAEIGDFGAVGSAHVHLTNDLPNQVSVSAGTLGEYEGFVGGTHHFDDNNRIWAAVDVLHLDGPWHPPSDFNKINAAVRFSHGSEADGFSLTGMYHKSAGRLETDQSIYAVQTGLIDRFGVLDPTDHGRSERWSLSGHYGATGDHWKFSANAFTIHSTMVLNNNFTHFLADPVNGDQEQQDETRDVHGADAAFSLDQSIFGIRSETTLGVQERYDRVYVDRRHTHELKVLDYCMALTPLPPDTVLPPPPPDTPLGALESGGGQAFLAVGNACNADIAHINDLAGYVQNTTYWVPWLRTVVGIREEYFWSSDHSLTTGFQGSSSQTLAQPKGSLVLGPWNKTELYVSAGRGFHSNDVRGVFGTVPLEGLAATAGLTPLLAPVTGEEVGLRTNIIPKVNVEVALFQEDFTSQLAYDEDQGQDRPTAPSRRQGIEVSAQYHPFHWIEFNTDLAFSKARYRGSLDSLQNDFGLDGPYVANAPNFIGSVGVLVDNLGPWSGALQWRALGSYDLADGDPTPQDKGYNEFNLEVGYQVNRMLKLEVSVYNLLNSKANAAAFYYESQLTPDPASDVTGVQFHPLEPLSARFSATVTF